MRLVCRTGHRRDLTIDTADIVWVTNGPELWVLLTFDRNWSPNRDERWLADSWVRLLLD